MCIRIVRERDNGDEGKQSADRTETELLEAMKNWASVGKKAPTASEFGREVGKVVRMDTGLCVQERVILIRSALTECIRRKY